MSCFNWQSNNWKKALWPLLWATPPVMVKLCSLSYEVSSHTRLNRMAGMKRALVPLCFVSAPCKLQWHTSVIAAPALKSACCATYLKYYAIAKSENATCRNTPGVLTAGLVSYIFLKHLHRVCCANLQTSTPPRHTQLKNTGLYNTFSRSSICTSCVYVYPLAVFARRSRSKRKGWMQTCTRTCISGMPGWSYHHSSL